MVGVEGHQISPPGKQEKVGQEERRKRKFYELEVGPAPA